MLDVNFWWRQSGGTCGTMSHDTVQTLLVPSRPNVIFEPEDLLGLDNNSSFSTRFKWSSSSSITDAQIV